MANLSSTVAKKKIKLTYTGEKITPSKILYTPIKIHHFEFMDSQFNQGNKVLVAQVSWIKKETGEIVHGMLETEARDIVGTLKEQSHGEAHYTKIVKKGKTSTFLSLVAVTPRDRDALKDIVDPCPGKGPFDKE